MPLNPVEPGLHRLRYDSKSVAKVNVHVQPGDELAVSEDVAAQLVAADPHFKPVGEPDEAKTEDESKPARKSTRAKKNAAAPTED